MAGSFSFGGILSVKKNDVAGGAFAAQGLPQPTNAKDAATPYWRI